MALKSTIFKAELQIADLDRNYYADPCADRCPPSFGNRRAHDGAGAGLHAPRRRSALAFGKGLSAEDEPDLWRKDLTGAIKLWIEVGLPDEKRSPPRLRPCRPVVVLSYGGRVAEMWWQQNQAALKRQDNLAVINLSPEDSRALAALAARGMQLQCTLQDGEAWLIVDGENTRIAPETRLAPTAP
jgi:uncharacterized protein YaeQ